MGVNDVIAVLDDEDNKENNIEMDELTKKKNENGDDGFLATTTKALHSIFGKEYVELMENYTHHARYQVGSDDMSIADVFEHLESIKEQCDIVNYAVSQISLEQIFLGFAKEQREEDNPQANGKDDRSKCDKALAGASGLFVIG